MADRAEIKFHEHEIEFGNYPFAPASVYPSGTLPYNAIKEVVPDAGPAEVRTLEDEVLFVGAAHKDSLVALAQARGIPVVKRVDVWSLILDPFVDTEFSKEYTADSMMWLKKCGISPEECETLRKRVGPAMVAYNLDSGLWDWAHLGHYDVLSALSGVLSGEAHRLPSDEMRAFYWDSMKIAARARVR